MSTNLTASVTSSQTFLPLLETSDFPQKGLVQVESELILYSFSSDQKLLNCIRGYAGTTPTTHAQHIAVTLIPLATPDVLFNSGAVAISGMGSPTNDSTGLAVAGEGSLYIDVTNGHLWINQGPSTDPVWVQMSTSSLGNLGAYQSSVISSLTPITATDMWQTITSINLPTGDWDVTAELDLHSNTVPDGELTAWHILVTQDAISQSDDVIGDNHLDGVPSVAAYNTSLVVANYRVLNGSLTTVYLQTQASFSAGTPQVRGRLSARRWNP